ncbi:hypothetical protein RchiOBHm_Chr6g0304161 [Rosa chinensis]|uniref:Uncharacterized protein n=1 Tax=Rosa chinensis TaxID=74649 RepID=A0A2P6PZJ7_ROSCH|nr:uncharacterized protein LOC112171753 [Rosa chinensis]PRQ27326.1 hypothetical protein RchiOBHm_Chr6g0304161 [Rosa chinensis]
MEEEREKQVREEVQRKEKEKHGVISDMKPLNREAYGGGLYANEKHYSGEAAAEEKPHLGRASDTQSADGPVEPSPPPKHKPPPSTGDRDLDITGQTYIQ